MSQYKVKTVHHPLNCTVEVPGSKSITNRALLMAALSDGECTLHSVLFSDDSRHFLTSLIAESNSSAILAINPTPFSSCGKPSYTSASGICNSAFK